MRTKMYSCPNGCLLPPRKKELKEFPNHTYGFGYRDFSYCPKCGCLMPHALKKVKAFFEVYNIHPLLKRALNLVYKSEFEAAAREAFVVLETVLRKKSGLDCHGFDLATKALKFEKDSKSGKITSPPLISINKLQTESDRNEQDGIRYMLMGFFQGPRNLYQHNRIGAGVDTSIAIIIEVSFFLHLLDGNSMTKNGRWIPCKVDYYAIYNNMPNKFDRFRLIRMLKKRKKHLDKHAAKSAIDKSNQNQEENPTED